MNCLRCNTPNEEGAKCCKNCGLDLAYALSKGNTNYKQTINQLLVLLGLQSFVSICYLILNKMIRPDSENFNLIYDYVGWALDAISISMFLIFAIITKHKNARLFIIIFLIIKIITVIGYRVLKEI